ncbi:MAG: SCO family protein [Chitinophagaceae bacterium]|nr:SCO family protein [Chitinophagaceae bacterium]MCA6451780.1 SCO family protein [Chitinophagaceae bacterium]MCA6455836.1 SCO family protein [Chitinophagaceae bacterium]MCA6459137.1 SCO family protein [Chitinophagaceae bacterium]MCA6465667.1 SCO family protein [Chitinophagaceae bacterium]
MNKKLLGYLLFFVVLVLGFYYFLFRDTDKWKTKLAVISYVKPFHFTNQDGLPFTDKDMLGKVSVVEYFFTNCKGICPKMNHNMKKVFEQFKNEPDFMIVAHTCDPERDSAQRLKVYADSMKIDNRKWVMLTGRKDSLYQQARSSYLLDDPKNNVEKIEDQFIHTQFFALVDRDGKVRGQVYDGLKQPELDRLAKDIRSLLEEKSGTANFVNGLFNTNPK